MLMCIIGLSRLQQVVEISIVVTDEILGVGQVLQRKIELTSGLEQA